VAVDDGAWVGSRRRSVDAFLAVVIAAYAALASTTRPNTLPALVAVVLPAAAVTGWILRRPSEEVEPSPSLRRTTMLWACLMTAAFLWETGAFIGEHIVGQYQYPTLSLLAEPALGDPVVRFGAWAVWLLAGWRLVRR
jgi:hypothetical protein